LIDGIHLPLGQGYININGGSPIPSSGPARRERMNASERCPLTKFEIWQQFI